MREYVAALEREMALRSEARATDAPREGSEIDTLYLGGGTPSRLGGDGVARVLDLVRAHARLAPGAEVTIEANPEDVSADAARTWRAAGVNRLSLGVQSFDDRVLSWMHRVHDARAIGRAVDAVREAGIANLSIDLIFALPESLGRDWERDVSLALALEPDHLSLYGLTIEPHTPLGRWRTRGAVAEAPDERYEREFLYARETLGAAGLEHYEVSNYARPGFESRHNSAYWSGVAYDALGPSAHGFDGDERWWNVSAYAEWRTKAMSGVLPEGGRERLDEEAREAERVYLGLRTRRGLAIDGADLARVERWIEAGWASMGGDGRLSLTAPGWLRLDALAADLTSVRSRY